MDPKTRPTQADGILRQIRYPCQRITRIRVYPYIAHRIPAMKPFTVDFGTTASTEGADKPFEVGGSGIFRKIWKPVSGEV